MSKLIKFNIKLNVDGKEQFTAATVPVKDFKKAVGAAQVEVKDFSARLANLKNAVGVVKDVSEAFDKLSELIKNASMQQMNTAQMTGLDGKELREVQGRVKAIADTFGGEYNEVLLSANNLSRAFGISIQNSLKLVQDGFVSGANANGEFVDVLKEYPRYFKEAGISAKEFIAITANAAKQGIYSDKGVDTIKEGNLRIREMTTATAAALDAIGISSQQVQLDLQKGYTTTFEVMQQVGAKLAELPASASVVGTAIADIFGGPGEDAGLEYIKSLATINTNLEELVGQADEASRAMGDQADAMSEAGGYVAWFNNLLAKMKGLTPYLNVAGQVGTSIIALSMMAQAFSKLNLVTLAGRAATAVWATAVGAARWICFGSIAPLNSLTAGTVGFTAAEGAGTIATRLFAAALRGLLVATGVGAVLSVVSMAVEGISTAMASASGKADELAKKSGTLASAQDRVRTAMQNASSSIAPQLANIRRLTNLIHDNNAANEDRKKAIDDLRRIIPNYTAELSDEGKIIKENTKALDDYISKLRETARAKAAQEMLEDSERRILNYETYKEGWGRSEKGYSNLLEQNKKKLAAAKKEQAAAQAASNGTRETWARLYRANQRVIKLEEEQARLVDKLNTAKRKRAEEEDHIAKENKVANEIAAKVKAATTTTPDLDTGGGGGGGHTYAPTLPSTDEDKSDVYIPGAEDGLSTLAELDEAIRYYRALQEEQTEAEVGETQRIINKLTAKKDAIQAVINKVKEEGKAEEKDPAEEPVTKASTTARKYDFVQEKASAIHTVQQYFEVGLIGADEAQKEIDGINKTLEEIGAKPVEIEIKSNLDNKKSKSTTEVLESIGGMDIKSFKSLNSCFADLSSLEDTQAKGASIAAASLMGMGQAMQALGGNSAAAKAGLVMAAIGNLVLSFSMAMKDASKNWITWLAFGISGAATLATVIAQISAFETGGIVGGSSTFGDKKFVRVNSGEMILNQTQQAHLYSLINGAATTPQYLPTYTQPNVAYKSDERNFEPREYNLNLGGKWQYKIKGKDIVASYDGRKHQLSRA